jgi:AbrB family looped-hinge helix DNA binding protein
MEIVTISPKFQVVIPAALRRSLGLKAGQKVMVTEHDGRVDLRPLRPIEDYRGIVRGIDTDVPRDEDRV